MSSSSSSRRVGTVNRELTTKWTRVEPTDSAPEGRIGHTLCTTDDGSQVILYGGVTDCADGTSKYLDDYFIYNFHQKEWARVEVSGKQQQPRAFHTAVFWKDRMYIFGGCNGRGRFNRLFSIALDGHSQQYDVSNMPATRYCHSATVFEGRMYVFGGKCGGRNSNKRLDDLWVYSFEAGLWSHVDSSGNGPSPRSAHAAFTYGRTMTIFGGRSDQGECCEDLYSFHYDTNVWRKIETTESLFGRARHSFAVHNSRVIVFGGWNGKKKLNDLFYYNMDSGTFEVIADTDDSGPSRRECHVAVMCNNTMVVFGGRFRNDFMNATSELMLGAKSLKEACRDWLLLKAKPEETIDSVPSKTVPYRLTQFLNAYKDTHVPQPQASSPAVSVPAAAITQPVA